MHPNFGLIDLTLTPRYETRDRERLVRRGQEDEEVISRSGIDWSGGVGAVERGAGGSFVTISCYIVCVLLCRNIDYN